MDVDIDKYPIDGRDDSVVHAISEAVSSFLEIWQTEEPERTQHSHDTEFPLSETNTNTFRQSSIFYETSCQRKESDDENPMTATIGDRVWGSFFENDKTLSEDSFSFMMFVPHHSSSFAIAFITFALQVTTFTLILMDMVDLENAKNPIGIPPNVDTPVRICQVLAIIIGLVTQEDLRTAVILIHEGYQEEQIKRAFDGSVTYEKWTLSVLCRFIEGFMGLVTTFFLIMTQETVFDLLLTFTAVEFVSQLDDVAFFLAASGFFGASAKESTKTLMETTYTVNRQRGLFLVILISNTSLFIIILAGMMSCWGVITKYQYSGKLLCDTIQVQFSDEFIPALGAFSGMYDRHGLDYMERLSNDLRRDNTQVGMAKISYCFKQNFWSFNIINTDHNHDPCEWLARSIETSSFDLITLASSDWIVRKESVGQGTLENIVITCFECWYDDDVCGSQGTCSSNGDQCTCNSGWYGLRCDFPSPCFQLETDVRLNNFLGSREWSSEFRLLQDEQYNNRTVEVYNRPVYVNEYEAGGQIEYDIILFTGRRWVVTNTILLLGNHSSNIDLIYFLSKQFHAYWWDVYSIAFISEPVDVNTPKDSATPVSLSWYDAKTKWQQSTSQTQKLSPSSDNWISVQLVCANCDNATNPCFYDGICKPDNTNSTATRNKCQCSLGSSGTLCQITPVQNGNCDVFFNTVEFSYDGGDCCESTCQSTSDFLCGEGVVGRTEDGLIAFGSVGYPHCIDPTFTSMISGSPTLFQIVKRGYVICGVRNSVLPGFVEKNENGDYIGFEVDLCGAIAAAVLGDPEAIQLFETAASDRFINLLDGNYDVLIRTTTFTAERDIIESRTMTGFTYASSPYLYDGLKYGCIPPYRECADNLDWLSPECLHLKICVATGTTWLTRTQELFPKEVIVTADGKSMFDFFTQGLCNCIAGESTYLISHQLQAKTLLNTTLEIGNKVFSKEPLAAVTKQDDRIWSRFVSWIFEALIQAEQFNITKASSTTSVASGNGGNLALNGIFGKQFAGMFQNAIAAHGNYGEIYKNNLEMYLPRGGLNNINNGTTSLIYSFPFGKVSTQASNPAPGSTLKTILERGVLNCGVEMNKVGFAREDKRSSIWSGFNVDICKGIAAAIFSGAQNVNFRPVSYSSRFKLLDDKITDVLVSGVSHTLSREINEPTTGKGFDFSSTYFYDGMRFAGRRPYVTCADRLIFHDIDFSPECSNTRICVTKDTTWFDALIEQLDIPMTNIVVTSREDETYRMLASGECNVVVGESIDIANILLLNQNKSNIEYYEGGNKYTRERLAVVSRSNDAQFSDFIRWIIFALFYAAENDIRQENYYDMPGNVYLFGDRFPGLWQDLIRAVGNYDEIYKRNLEGIFDRDRQNQINSNNGPQLFANIGVEGVL